MFACWTALTLACRERERPNQGGARFAWLNHGINIATFGGIVGVGKPFQIIGGRSSRRATGGLLADTWRAAGEASSPWALSTRIFRVVERAGSHGGAANTNALSRFCNPHICLRKPAWPGIFHPIAQGGGGGEGARPAPRTRLP